MAINYLPLKSELQERIYPGTQYIEIVGPQNEVLHIAVETFVISDDLIYHSMHLRNKTLTSIVIYDVDEDAVKFGKPLNYQDLSDMIYFFELLIKQGYTQKHFDKLIFDLYNKYSEPYEAVLEFYKFRYDRRDSEPFLNVWHKKDHLVE